MWVFFFGFVCLFYVGLIRLGGFFILFYVFCNINFVYFFVRFYLIRIILFLRNLFLIIFLFIFLRYYSGVVVKGKFFWFIYLCLYWNSRGVRNYWLCGMFSCEIWGWFINFWVSGCLCWFYCKYFLYKNWLLIFGLLIRVWVEILFYFFIFWILVSLVRIYKFIVFCWCVDRCKVSVRCGDDG